MTDPIQCYLYEQLAQDLTQSIQEGVYAIGQRLPSLRNISETYAVSLATVIQSYSLLEQAGYIEARPKSGYYVLPWKKFQPNEPPLTQPVIKPTNVSVAQLAMSLIHEARQQHLVKLGAAVPEADILPLASLSRTLAGVSRRHWRSLANYENENGNENLRKQIARLMAESGYRCKSEEVIITNGCLESLNLALRSVAKPSDTIAIESPTYFGILQVIETLGMRALEIPTHPNYGIDPDILQKTVKKQKISACVLIPSFSNPLGACMPDKNKQRVVSLLEQAAIPLIEDDIYGGLSYETPRPKSAKSYDKSGNVIYCSSFSKTVSPGLRIGWILPGRFTEQVRYKKFLGNISTSVHPQIALAEFLERGLYRKNTRRAARIYHRRMEQLKHWISEYFPADTLITQPRGGFLLWLELPKNTNALTLYRNAIDKRIAITPGILFSAQGQYQHHIRLSCGAVEGELARKSLKILGALV
ncbi:MAG: PLP-dependent aminotransferase family protein [Gammaproteobacteria bacterium]|nr:PLP-dependent aminotransferase family protein [Gammaproteobacteria bacterium]